MSNVAKIEAKALSPETLEKLIIHGDLSKLSPIEKVSYYNAMCEACGLNPASRPFDYIKFQHGKEALYANKGCAEQLRKAHNISIKITEIKQVGDAYVVGASASMPGGRCDEATGAVSVANLKGDALANVMMKAETKAKRRVTLSICGLGMLDESEVETIPGAQKVRDVEEQEDDGRPAALTVAPAQDELEPESGNHNPDLPYCEDCNAIMVKSKNKEYFYCPNWKDGATHSKPVKVSRLPEFLDLQELRRKNREEL